MTGLPLLPNAIEGDLGILPQVSSSQGLATQGLAAAYPLAEAGSQPPPSDPQGLSAAAGYDFTNSEKFARDYPGMLQYGFTKKIQMMANFSVGENILWGYYLQNVAETRFDNGEPHPVYQALRQLSELFKDWFVVTTNVDALFQRNGFDQLLRSSG